MGRQTSLVGAEEETKGVRRRGNGAVLIAASWSSRAAAESWGCLA